MITEPLFIDVNIPMYAAGAEHPNRESCVWVMTAITRGELRAVADVELVQEIFHRYGSLGRWDVADRMALNVLRIVPIILPITTEDIFGMVELARQYGPAHGIPARDLIHAAVMKNNGLKLIVSTDKHFDRIEGITRIPPQQLMQEQS